jgi:hypothetical protein
VVVKGTDTITVSPDFFIIRGGRFSVRRTRLRRVLDWSGVRLAPKRGPHEF